MASSHEAKEGEVYVCKDCGIELKVATECKGGSTSAQTCGCHSAQGSCTLTCCGKEMVKTSCH